jgi:hypothetical protein
MLFLTLPSCIFKVQLLRGERREVKARVHHGSGVNQQIFVPGVNRQVYLVL